MMMCLFLCVALALVLIWRRYRLAAYSLMCVVLVVELVWFSHHVTSVLHLNL